MLNIFYTLFQMRHTVDQNGQFGIQGNLPVDVGLTMHEATIRVLPIVLLLVFFVHLGFSFREEQLLLAVLNF